MTSSMKRFHPLKVALSLLLVSAGAMSMAQTPLRSPEVGADRRVTFRIKAPNAKEVAVGWEGGKNLKMTKDDQGVWSVSTDPLEPDYYGYSITVDGVGTLDSLNTNIKPNLLGIQSVVHVPGPLTLPWEVNSVPHGMVNHHFYKSSVVGDERDFFVYTPPGYDARARKSYPVLYLLHGFSDDASGWTAVGKANVILDNLIAQGKAKPMLVVMPLGYGAPEIVNPNFSGRRDPNAGQRNTDKFTEALLTEVVPQVEQAYRVNKDRNSRAIAGLSMGGGESMTTGLNHLDQFAYLATFSGAVSPRGGNFDTAYSKLSAKDNDRIKLLWIACGSDDFLIQPNRQFRDWLKSKDVKATYVESTGGHVWMNWRRYLAEFAPLLFK